MNEVLDKVRIWGLRLRVKAFCNDFRMIHKGI